MFLGSSNLEPLNSRVPRSAVRLTAKGATVGILAVLFWVLGLWLSNKPLFLLAYTSVLGLGGAVLACGRKPSVEAQRDDLPPRLVEGTTYRSRFSVVATRRIASIELQELGEASLGVVGIVRAASLTPNRPLSASIRLVAQTRGRKRLGPLIARRFDPFGLVCKTWELLDSVELIVHPKTFVVGDRVVARAWEDPPIRPPFSASWPTGFELYGFRDYVVGDDTRRIDWRASARSQSSDGLPRILVRESEQGICDRVRIVIDTRGRGELLESTVRFGASLALKHLLEGSEISVSDGRGVVAKRVRGSRRRMELLDAFSDIEFCDKGLNLEAIGRSHGQVHQVVVATDLTNDEAARLRLLSSTGTHVLLVLIVSDETDPAVFSRAAKTGCAIGEVHSLTSSTVDFKTAGASR